MNYIKKQWRMYCEEWKKAETLVRKLMVIMAFIIELFLWTGWMLEYVLFLLTYCDTMEQVWNGIIWLIIILVGGFNILMLGYAKMTGNIKKK